MSSESSCSGSRSAGTAPELSFQNRDTGSTIAFTTGCNLVARVPVGEMYKTPSGQWKENTGTPELDGRCK